MTESEKEIIILSLSVIKKMAIQTNGLGILQKGDEQIIDEIIAKINNGEIK